MCVAKLVASLRRLVLPLITTEALSCMELDERRRIVSEEKDHWDFLFYGLRVGNLIASERASMRRSLLVAPLVPHDYTFSAPLSHPSFTLPSQYCGRMATVLSGAKNVTTPFIAIA